MRKKLLSLALTLVMALALLPALPAAQAADVPGPNDLVITNGDFGTIEISTPNDFRVEATVTNASDRTIYLGHTERVGSTDDGPFQLYGGINNILTLKPGESTVIGSGSLLRSTAGRYPFNLRAEYEFWASFSYAGERGGH